MCGVTSAKKYVGVPSNSSTLEQRNVPRPAHVRSNDVKTSKMRVGAETGHAQRLFRSQGRKWAGDVPLMATSTIQAHWLFCTDVTQNDSRERVLRLPPGATANARKRDCLLQNRPPQFPRHHQACAPFDNKRTGRNAVFVEEGTPVGQIDRSRSSSGGDERVGLNPAVHRVARPDAFLGVTCVQDAPWAELLESKRPRQRNVFPPKEGGGHAYWTSRRLKFGKFNKEYFIFAILSLEKK